ncbi:armadillo-type protein, partial [Lentinula edodes]
LVETLAILSILISRFPSHLSASSLMPHPLAVLVPLLSHPRLVVRKRAIVTLSQFITISPPELFSELFTDNVLPYLGPSANIEKQWTTVNLVAAVARHSPSQLAPMLSEIMPGINKAVQREDDELREGCLQALEILLLRCPAEIAPYVPSIVQVGNQYIKYDPVSTL